MSVLFEVWKRTVPSDAVFRYEQIRRNIEALQDDGLIPNVIERAVDVGFGSGGGSIALADIFPKAVIAAVDNASAQQNHPQYRRRELPRWTSRFEFVPEDLKVAAPKLGNHDIVLASRIPFSDMDRPINWKDDSISAAQTLVALALMVEPETGTVLVGYDPHEDPGALWELAKRVDTGKLFNKLGRYGVKNGDDWLVLSGVKQEVLKKAKTDPKILLTDIGKKLPTMEELKNLWKP